MSADHHQQQHDSAGADQRDTDQDQGLGKLRSSREALETWDAWSMADTMRQALQIARQQGDAKILARFERYPEWTQGPSALEALDANRELVDRLTGQRWLAIRDARHQGHGWDEIGRTLGQSAEQVKARYLEAVDAQRRLAQQIPQLRYDPGWLELAEPNQADRAANRGAPNAPREDGHER